MTVNQVAFVMNLKSSIASQIKQGNKELASRLQRIVKYLPDSPHAAIAVAIESDMDSYFVEQLRETFRV